MEGQEQQLLSFLSTNQNLSREQPNNFLQYFCCLRVYHLNFYLLCSEFFMSKNTYIPNIHVCSIKVFWSRPIYSRVASADSAQHQSIRPLFCWWAARQWRERYAALKHSHHLWWESVRGEQEIQYFSQQHKHCTTVRLITDHKGTPEK